MNSNDTPTGLYGLIPAVNDLNKVPGFEPVKLMHAVVSPTTGEKILQLDLKYKKLWFRLAYPKGKIKLNRLRVTEKSAIFEALIYLDRNDSEPVASCTADCTSDTPDYIQAAQDAAIDRALTDAGFGIQFVKPPKTFETQNAVTVTPEPQSENAAEKPAEILRFKPEETTANTQTAPSYNADMPVEEIVKLMTYEEACGVVVDTGVCTGMTISQVAEKRSPSLKYYVYGGYKGSNAVKAAARIMLDAMSGQMAG